MPTIELTRRQGHFIAGGLTPEYGIKEVNLANGKPAVIVKMRLPYETAHTMVELKRLEREPGDPIVHGVVWLGKVLEDVQDEVML